MDNKSRSIILKTGNLLFFIGVILINFLANTLPIGGKKTGELSDSYPNLFTPAGITFSIWGVIYLLLLFFIIYQLITLFKTDPSADLLVNKINGYFILSCMMNILWIFAWHYQKILISFFIMILLLLSLIMIYIRLRRGVEYIKLPAKHRVFIFIPFSIYLGWITVATIANTTILLVKYQWSGFGISKTFWTIVVMAVAMLIGMVVMAREKDIFFNLVLIWAFAGIIIKRISVEPVINEIVITAVAGIGLLIVFMMVKIRKN